QAVDQGLRGACFIVVVGQPVAIAIPDVTNVDDAVAVLVRDRIPDVEGGRRIGSARRVDRVLVDEAAIFRGQPELVASTRIGARDAGSPAAGFADVDEIGAYPLAAP